MARAYALYEAALVKTDAAVEAEKAEFKAAYDRLEAALTAADAKKAAEKAAADKAAAAAAQALTTTITPARPLAGRWTGAINLVDWYDPPFCQYWGSLTLNLTQNGNAIGGDFDGHLPEQQEPQSQHPVLTAC
jgi:hypothetical protein